MSQHAVLSPSGAEKWMGCPGSAAMERGLPNDSNEYSDEGTAAHLLGSTCLEDHTPAGAQRYLDSKISVGSSESAGFDGAIWTAQGCPADFKVRRTYLVDEEMAEQVGKYVDRVRQYAADAQLLMPEQRISISPFTGEEGAEGTADAVVVRSDELQVHDLKYGMGVRVDAERNKQLMIYALGVREELDLVYGPFKRIRLVIHQPRLDHLSEWDCTSEELDAFGEEVYKASGSALNLYRHAPVNFETYLNPSENACRWCKAKATCPAAAKKLTDAFGADFEAVTSGVQVGELCFEKMTLGQKMAAIPLFEDIFKAVRAELERQLFAGVAIPGWKIVQGKRGNRSWKDLVEAEALLKKMRLPIEERYKMTLKSPPAIEKALKATPKRWARVLKADLIEQPDGQPSVAPESDPRPVWTPPDTANDFTATEEVVA